MKLQNIFMFDNFLEEEYHPSDPVFTHPRSSHLIFIGDVQSALDTDSLSSKNITTVVTAAKDMDHISYSSSILHIVYPLLDGKNQDIASFFDAFYNLVETNINKGNILVHCAAGISRSSTLVISYIMKFRKVGFRQAIAEVRKFRPSVLPNLGFERQLKKYQQSVKGPRHEPKVIKRSQEKMGSGQHFLMKTQVIPNFEVFGNKKEKIMSGNVVKFFDKGMDREKQVIKVYSNHPRPHDSVKGNETKHKKFVITKKAASFSRQPQRKNLMIDAIRQKQSKEPTTKNDRIVNSSLEEMKAIYLTRKAHERHNTTQRSGTFYNVRI